MFTVVTRGQHKTLLCSVTSKATTLLLKPTVFHSKVTAGLSRSRRSSTCPSTAVGGCAFVTPDPVSESVKGFEPLDRKYGRNTMVAAFNLSAKLFKTFSYDEDTTGFEPATLHDTGS